MLILKKLSAAERDGDHIYGVIRGSAENHGGRASSLTAPNPRAQADMLISAYRKAGIDPRTVGYIEAHGTGTPLGDPIEINGLKTAFSELAEPVGQRPVPQAWCGIGSLKSNIGLKGVRLSKGCGRLKSPSNLRVEAFGKVGSPLSSFTQPDANISRNSSQRSSQNPVKETGAPNSLPGLSPAGAKRIVSNPISRSNTSH